MADHLKLPERYRSLYRKLERGTWTASELVWLLESDPNLPYLIKWTINQKMLRLLGAIPPEAPAPSERAEDV
jgi:hypothetical protein